MGSRIDDYALADAARRVVQLARAERFPLNDLAWSYGEDLVEFWFANNIIHVVAASGRRPDSAEWEILTETKTHNLLLDLEMRELRPKGAEKPTFIDLCVSPRDFEKYLDHVRTARTPSAT